MKKLIAQHQKLFGYIFGILAILIYAVINIISQSEKTNNGMNTFIYALLFVIVKEFFATIAYLISGSPLKKYKEIIMLVKEQKSYVLLSSIAGLFGGVIGFTLTTVGGIYIGSALGSPLYSLETFIVMAVMYFLFKKRTSHLHVIGILIVAIIAIAIPLGSLVIEGVGNSKNAWLGAGMLLLGVACWSIESIIFDIMTDKQPQLSTAPLILIKQVSSLVLGLVIVLPIFGAAFTSAKEGYQELGTLFGSNAIILLYAFIAGVLLYFGRLLFFASLKYTGATTANMIYSFIPFIQTPLAYIAKAIDSNVDYVGRIHHEFFWVFMVLMAAGIVLAYFGQKHVKGMRL